MEIFYLDCKTYKEGMKMKQSIKYFDELFEEIREDEYSHIEKAVTIYFEIDRT